MQIATFLFDGTQEQFKKAGETAEQCGFGFTSLASGCGVEIVNITYRDAQVGVVVAIRRTDSNEENNILLEGRLEIQMPQFDLVRMILTHHGIKFSRHF